MKKIDLHIHTLSTMSDSKTLDFSMDKLKDYVETRKIDAIAITNHNVFDREQFALIQSELEIAVYPGIEVDLAKGHILMIAENTPPDIQEFSSLCDGFKKFIKDQSSSLSLEEFFSVIPSDKLKKFLLIPHYVKSPIISDNVIEELNKYTQISAGEVHSARKFVELKNKSEDLTPVFFSDERISDDIENFSIQQTYLNISDISLAAIKVALTDKSKVSLSLKEGKNLFELSDGIVASTGLNVLIGERSSGKTHLLNEIFKTTNNTKYIRQFELVERSDEESESNFNSQLLRDESIFVSEYLREFSEILKTIVVIDPKKTMTALNNFVNSLLKNAENTEKKDSFAKATLFSEEPFKIKKLDTLAELIKSTQVLLENKEYADLIDEAIERESLEKLITRLIMEHRNLSLDLEIKRKVNLNNS